MFKIWARSDQWLLRYSNFHILRSSSIRGHLHWNLLTLVWSHELIFKIWEISNQLLMRYSNFHFLRSSSIRGHLHLKVVFIETFFWLWFGPMSLCLKFEKDLISDYWDIQIFIFCGHLPFEVVFLWRSSSLKPILTLVWSQELMFKIWGISN